MVERIVLTALVALALFGVRGLLNWSTNRYRRQRAVDLLPAVDQRPPWFILAFSTPGCVACQTVQVPALEELAQRFPGQVTVSHIDPTMTPALARRFGIFIVPSTVVLDHNGWVLAINHSPAGVGKLAGQLTGGKSRPSGVDSIAIAR